MDKENLFAQGARPAPKRKAGARFAKPSPGKPARGLNRKSTTIMLDADKKIAIKKYAAENETNLSDLFNEWIAEKCGEYL